MSVNQASYSLSNYERETIINFNEDEKTALVYTHNKSLMKKLDEYCLKHPKLYKLEKEHWYGKHLSKSYIIPKKYVGIRQPKILSEENKIKFTANLRKQNH